MSRCRRGSASANMARASRAYRSCREPSAPSPSGAQHQNLPRRVSWQRYRRSAPRRAGSGGTSLVTISEMPQYRSVATRFGSHYLSVEQLSIPIGPSNFPSVDHIVVRGEGFVRVWGGGRLLAVTTPLEWTTSRSSLRLVLSGVVQPAACGAGLPVPRKRQPSRT